MDEIDALFDEILASVLPHTLLHDQLVELRTRVNVEIQGLIFELVELDET